MLIVNVALYFAIYYGFMSHPAYTDETQHRCYVVGKMYEGPWVGDDKHHTAHDPRYVFILHDEKQRSFHLYVTPECYFEHHEGEYLYFELSEKQIWEDDKIEDENTHGFLITMVNVVWTIGMLVVWFVNATDEALKKGFF